MCSAREEAFSHWKICCRGVWRVPEHREQCLRNCEHQVWVFGVQGKKETHFETKVNLCSRCSNTANGVQGPLNIINRCSVFGEKKRPTLKLRSICVRGVRRVPEHS